MLFFAQVVLARKLGPKDYGIYAYALSWMTILSIFAKLGFETSLLRFVPEYKVHSEWSKFRGIINFSFSTVLLASIVISLIAAIVLYLLRSSISSEIVKPFFIMLLVLPFFSLTAIRQSCLRGLKHVVRAELPEGIIRPLILILVIYFSFNYVAPFDARDAWIAQLIAVVISFVVGTFLLVEKLPNSLKKYPSDYEKKAWLSISWPMLLMNSMNIILNQSAIVILGFYDSAESVAIFSAASRIIILIGFILLAVNSIAAPMISEFYYSGKRQELQSLLTFASKILFGFTLFSSVVIIVFGKWILGLFGKEFIAGYVVLLVLVVGHATKSLMGPASYLLNLTGYQNLTAKIMAIAVLISIACSFLLIPKWGAMGAALASTISMVFWNICLLVLNLKTVKLNPSITSLISKSP